MIKQRVITACVSLVILLAAIWFGNPWFLALMVVLAILGAVEFYRMATYPIKHPLTIFGIIWTSLFIIRSVIIPYIPSIDDFGVALLLLVPALVIPSIWLALYSPRRNFLNNWVWAVVVIFYLGWTLSHYVALRDMPQGKEWVLFALLPTFACDTSAFFVGRAWGKHQLAPTISPGKTKEGAMGGVLGAMAASLLLTFIFKEFGSGFSLGYWHAAILGCLISIFAQLGDLVESRFKRIAKVKDSGTLLPGHGGILDRIDSIVFTGLVVYYYVSWFTG